MSYRVIANNPFRYHHYDCRHFAYRHCERGEVYPGITTNERIAGLLRLDRNDEGVILAFLNPLSTLE